MKIRKMPVNAALIMPDALRDGVSTQSVSCAGNYQVRIGRELETGMVEALSQVFDNVDVVNDKAVVVGNY